ncbi:Atu4866 domain-containing protein [Mycolicibacterium parafortuitum]|uniref:Atu4866 domain-containing protein n=1 Tax=Mycolicibacterium parafortuitum TaxID=39692 RepID=UPI001E2D350E|nr:Atu4866 domain-containing protein [Mycolicibacterium parafortuitum]
MTPKSLRRTATVVVAVLVAATMVGCAVSGTAGGSPGREQERRNTELVRDAFARGVSGQDSFYAILAEDVQWTVVRAEAPRTYTNRAEFLRDGAGPIVSRLDGPIRAEVHELVADGDTVVARWRGVATARDGAPYVNEYVWVMTLRDERVSRVSAYLDFVALDELLQRVTPAHPYVGMWVTPDGHIRQELRPDGRYDEARGGRVGAYTGRYEVRGTRIDYWDDSGFTADGTFVSDDELHHGGMVFRRES